MRANAYESIIDMDRHVIEPAAMWGQYLAPSLREHAPRWTPVSQSGESIDARLERLGDRALLPVPAVLSVAGRPVWRGLSEVSLLEMGLAAERRAGALQCAQTALGHLSHMDASGVARSVLLPTYASYLVYDDEASAHLSRGYADAYNRWLADLCSTDPSRLIGAALLSRSEPETMVGDLEHARELGHHAVVIRGEPIAGHALSSRAYDRFWRACESSSLCVLIHGGTHARVATAGAERFETHFGQHVCSHPLETMMALVSLLEGGVLARYPALRVGLLEGGSSWLPHWLGRLDQMWAYCRRELRGRVERPPSEHFRRQCFIALEPGEVLLEETVANVGAGSFVFGSDYPHLDHTTHLSDELANMKARFDCETSKQILESNPVRLLGLEPTRQFDDAASASGPRWSHDVTRRVERG